MNINNSPSIIHLDRRFAMGPDHTELYWTKFTPGRKPQFVTAELTLHDNLPYANTSPGIVFTDDECQQLADALWEKGFRPRAAAGSNGQLEAVNHHLQDMRTIAFQACNLPVPKP